MICPKCQTVWPDELKAVLKFCGACGASMTAVPQGEPTPATPPGGTASHPGGELRCEKFTGLIKAHIAPSQTVA